MTHLERMQEVEVLLRTLFEKLQWQGDAESIELVNEALMRLTELKEQETLLQEIF